MELLFIQKKSVKMMMNQKMKKLIKAYSMKILEIKLIHIHQIKLNALKSILKEIVYLFRQQMKII